MSKGDYMTIRIHPSVFVILISSGLAFSLSACQSREDTISDISSISLEQEDSHTTDITVEEESFDYFSSDVLEIEELIDTNQLNGASSKAKEIFVRGAHFIFYDGKISGVTFDELAEQGREITMNNLETLGKIVDSVVPGWREELSEKYQVVNGFVNSVYLSGLDQIREYLGDKNYQALGEIKDQVLGDMTDTFEGAREHVKSWYEDR